MVLIERKHRYLGANLMSSNERNKFPETVNLNTHSGTIGYRQPWILGADSKHQYEEIYWRSTL